MEIMGLKTENLVNGTLQPKMDIFETLIRTIKQIPVLCKNTIYKRDLFIVLSKKVSHRGLLVFRTLASSQDDFLES